MSYNEWDAAEDEFYNKMYRELGPLWAEEHDAELYEKHAEQAIKHYPDEQLTSYYRRHLDIAKPAIEALKSAREFLEDHAQASFIFAAIAAEVIWKRVLLKPMLFGLIYPESLADLVIALFESHTPFDKLRRLLVAMISHYSGLDIQTLKRQGSTDTLVDEIKEISELRNRVVHTGLKATRDDALLARQCRFNAPRHVRHDLQQPFTLRHAP